MDNSVQKIIDLLNEELHNADLGQNPEELYDPLRYILALGGKRLRPLLAVLAYQIYKDDNLILRPALAVELFHNFTLIHDDIMDEAPIRRGKQTVHEKWDANTAILSGDVMLVRAYDFLLDSDPKYLPEIISFFNKCAAEVCEGQQIDMNFEKREDVSISEYLEMIRLKTAVLLGFSLRMGAILGDASKKDQDILDQFGQTIGLGFQLRDDYLDAYANEGFGKQVGGDIISNKKTYLTLIAFANADPAYRNELLSWFGKKEFDKEDKVQSVLDIYEKLNVQEETLNLINEKFSEAFDLIPQLEAENKEGVDALITYTQSLIGRKY